jgi:uncharacterized membrane protein
VFLAIGLVAGVAFVIVTPPFKGADEPAHFYRTYQISEGGIVAERREGLVGGLLPSSLREAGRPGTTAAQLGGARMTPLSAADRAFIDFRTTAPYSPAPYLPQALAIGAGRVLGLPPLMLLYLGRLAGLGACLMVVFLAIRITPAAKHVLLLIAAAPMALRQMALLSADGLTNAGAFLLIAVFLRLSLSTPPTTPPRPGADGAAASTRLRGSSVAAFFMAAIAVALFKPAYVALLFLFFLCPVERLGDRRRYVIVFLAMVGLAAVTLAVWFWAIRALYVAQPIAPDADPARQLAGILLHPVRYASVLLDNLLRNGGRYVWECLGYAGHVPASLGWIHLAVLALVALVDAGRPQALDWRAKAVVLLVLAVTYVLVSTYNYLGWSPVGADRIGFVQGRYYLPVAPLGFLLLANRRFAAAVSPRVLTGWSACAALLAALVALRSLASRWYGL